MSAESRLVFSLSVFWTALYALRFYRRRTRRISTLPTLTSSASPASTELFRSSATRITLINCHLRYQSSAWNALHQSSSARLAKSTASRSVLQLVYDVGTVLGVLGILGSVLLLVWTTAQLASSLYTRSVDRNLPSNSGAHHKRSVDEDANSALHEAHAAPALQLIIPGLTTPLHHLPLLLVALLTTQVIHECGHAVAAALDSIPLTSAGLGLTLILPSAFVAFPTEETESLPPRSRARLISAGAFHNLLFWLALGAAAWLPTSELAWPLLGYRDVSQYGRAVLAVDQGSPLYGYIPVGAVIYKVGDETLASQEGAARRWESLMSASQDSSMSSLGWCAEEAWFSAQDSSCCTARSTAVASSSCFVAIGEVYTERCVDPLRFLQPARTDNVRRCTSATECGHSQLCLRPRSDQELVSLTMHMPPWWEQKGDSERTVVWQGDRSEILDEVEVGDWLPRYSWLPIGLPFVWGTLFSYLRTLTLSLYFFNLLPLPFLDGGQLFDTLYDGWAADTQQGYEAVELDRLEEGMGDATATLRGRPAGSRSGRKAHCRRAVHVGVGTLTGCCIVLSLVNTYI
ncbi:hypothetical protein BV20DRAFT_1022387 [Pilatotrama ljubarskyi]|nr:hypothetical protein BV20DRAFT_1022387 [Pilatotrama ljubarskyi]